jgi:putative heme-binding domain-containing protein
VAGAGRETLLNNILDPNREVAPRFEAWKVTTRDGEEVTGLLAVDEAQTVSVKMASGVESGFNRAEIVSFTSTGRSLMPEGLDEGLSAAEMADLLRFIEALVQP